MWIAAEIISTIIWWMGMQFTPPFSNIYHPLQVGNVYSNSTNKEKLERRVIKIRKIISVFRRHKMNIFLEMEQKSTITQVEEDLIKTKKSDGKSNDFY